MRRGRTRRRGEDRERKKRPLPRENPALLLVLEQRLCWRPLRRRPAARCPAVPPILARSGVRSCSGRCVEVGHLRQARCGLSVRVRNRHTHPHQVPPSHQRGGCHQPVLRNMRAPCTHPSLRLSALSPPVRTPTTNNTRTGIKILPPLGRPPAGAQPVGYAMVDPEPGCLKCSTLSQAGIIVVILLAIFFWPLAFVPCLFPQMHEKAQRAMYAVPEAPVAAKF